MSILPSEVHTALSQLLQNLQSPNNDVRVQSEEALNADWVVGRPDVLLMALCEQIQGAEASSTRSFAAILFRRISAKNRKDPVSGTNKDLFLSLQEPQKNTIRAKLLECWGNEQLAQVRNKIGDAVAEIARQYSDDDQLWPELLGALFSASQSPDPSHREGSFRIFSTTPGIIQKQHEETVLAAFNKGFKDDDVTVRVSAMDAFAAFARELNKNARSKYFVLLPELLNILPPLKETGNSAQLSQALMSLIDLADKAPKMFKALFHNLVTFCITVIQDKELTDTTRQNALELMATFADNAPQMCKKDPSYTSEMVTQCLSLMTDVGLDDDDAQEWNEAEDLDFDESDSNHVAGEQCMDRLANKLGGASLLPPTFNWLPRMMTSSSWRDRHAALMAISAISEGCRELMLGELDKVLDLVIPALRDPHPRVRWAGCNALGQMSTDFAGTMQEKYHQTVLTNILPVLESAEPRVQAHAAAALVNFCEEAEKEILEPYLDPLLSQLLQLLQSPKRFVQEQALSTIATVADSAEAAFSRYYDTLMPLLFNVLKEEQSKEFRLLRAKAIECATLISLAVGKERMGQDAIALVSLLGAIQQVATDDDDPQASYLLHSWGRMCRVLGRDFVPYLPLVMPPLTKLAAAKADLQLLDNDESANQIENEEGWELVQLRGKVLAIRTSTLEDKNTAIELISIYAQVLEESFEPYVNDIMDKIALPSLAFFFHDPVRVSAARCVPYLLNCFKKAHGPQSTQLGQLWERTIEKVLEVLTSEPSILTLAEMYQCFYECVEVIGKNSLTEQHMAEFIKAAQSVLEEYIKRVEKRLEDQADEDEEPDEETLIAIEDDQTLLSDMNKAFHTIFKNMETAFLPYWGQLLNFYNGAAVSPDPTQRQWAICIFDDVLEFCGQQSWAYSQHIIEPLVNGMRDDVPANRQAAIYGVGVAAHKGGAAWSDFVAASVPVLFEATQRPTARDEDDVFATENACAAIAKILAYNNSKVTNVPEIMNAWIETFPVVNDVEAAPFAYSFMAQMIDQQHPTVLNQPARCFKFICDALEAETLQGQTAIRIIGAAKLLLQQVGMDVEQLLSQLPPDSQGVVRARFAEYRG